MSGNPDEFQRYLDTSGEEFLLLENSQSQGSARIRFTGQLMNSTVVWDCRLVTLDAECRYRKATGAECAKVRKFIDIGQPNERGVPLKVGLDIPCIDIPAIRKMVVMIRQYKKLDFGRHEFGDNYQC